MKRLKIILLCKIIIFLLLISIIVSKIYNDKRYYELDDNIIVGTVIDIQKDKFILKASEKIIVYNEDYNINLGDKVRIIGKLSMPSSNTNFYSFNYQKYLKSKNINYIMYNPKIEIIKHNNNVFYKIKQKIIEKLNNLKNVSYIKAFILADTSDIEKDTYQKNGISHLFAISGMHITFITSFLIKILSKISKKDIINNIIVSIFLIFYMFIVSYSISVVRASLMFILLFLNKQFKLNIKTYEILLFIMLLILTNNPFSIYSVSFKYSFIISFYLIIFSKIINKQKNYFIKLLITSIIAVLASFPITINNFHTINFLSIIFNIIFVPFFTYIIFPISLITIIIPKLVFLFDTFVNIFNLLSLWCSKINLLCLSFSYLNIYMIIFYYSLFTIFLYLFDKGKYYEFIFMIIYFIIHYYNLYFSTYNRVVIFDVKQGDSILINKGINNILIDTGGIQNSNYSLAINNIIVYMQSIGIKKINYLILSHGDYDHMGEAINLIENFKVEKVIFNCGEINDLEMELIKLLDKKRIKCYACINKIDDLYFLQTREYDNENDNSNVIYTEINGYKFMFMGDASSTTEKEILDKYELSNIDVLKVGHHGSKTSSSKEFIDEIEPKYSAISVGKNNKYGHPNKEVLANLKNTKIYRTDQDGSIMFKIKNNKLKIETCVP